jgi:nucleotide-binding universal stress UspA family protein
MKSILVPVAAHEFMPSVFACALQVAEAFGSHLEGFALRALATDYVPVDMVGGITWTRDEEADLREQRQARAAFDRAMRDGGIPFAPADGEASRPGFAWNGEAPAGDAYLGARARLFDLTVVARPVRGLAVPSLATLETVLFESGRPILIAPPRTPHGLGRRAVVAWNGSTETARAVTFALPLLARAERVSVLTVEGSTVPGPSGEEMARSLRRHGLPVEARIVDPGRRGAGEAILETAAALGCDLLVKGAYTQSRLRQMIFGGATSHLLAEAEVPVLMAH